METIAFGPNDYLVVLTGAGISAESGVRTFREHDGLWEKHRIEDVATPEAFERDPMMVWRFYHERRKQLKTVEPNHAHKALVDLENKLGGDRFLLITQNVDDLHERAGSRNLIHMHGELLKVRCTQCLYVKHTEEDMLRVDGEGKTILPHCNCGGLLRPHIVWFGEMPFDMDTIQQCLVKATHFMAVGTSGVVYPAAGFIQMARMVGAQTLGFNLEPPENHHLFDIFYQGKAGEMLPQWVEALQVEEIC